MRRREALVTGGGLLAAASAGCLETIRREDAWRELVVDPPEGVYVPPHADEMVTHGTVTADGRAISLAATRPHSFWTVADAERNRADVRSRHAFHLMVSVRDAESDAVVPAAVTTTIRRERANGNGDGRVDERSLWPMLSQRMGSHYGDNVPLEKGTYTATIRIGPTSADVTGEVPDGLEEPTTVDIEFEHETDDIEGLERRLIDEDEGRGEPGALEPMADRGGHGRDDDQSHGHDEHDRSAFGSEGARPIGDVTSDDIEYTAALVAADDREGTGTTALAVTARTTYNRYALPFASLAAAVLRDGERIASGSLRETIDPRHGHHYRTPIDPTVLERGDDLSIGLETPPQLARHEGYETAFLETGTATMELE